MDVIDSWMGMWKNGMMGRWKDEWMGGWMDGRID
jgi:hypothetical protein